MVTCPYCNIEIIDGYNFCVQCDRQVKCKECGSLLLANKTLCLICGTALISQSTGQVPMNEYSLEETQTADSSSRSIKMRFTDNAIDKAAPLFGVQVPLSRIVAQARNAADNKAPALSLPQSDGNITPVLNNGETLTIEATSPIANNDKDRALQFFEPVEEGQLTAIVSDFKGQNVRQQQQRFVVVYVWAYQQIFGRAVPSKQYIYDAAKGNKKLYDSNFNKAAEQIRHDALIETINGIRVQPRYVEKLFGILSEMEDGGVSGVAYWRDGQRSSRKKSSAINSEAKSAEWSKMQTEYDTFDIRSLTETVDQAIFAIWLVTKVLNVQHAVTPLEAYNFLKGCGETTKLLSWYDRILPRRNHENANLQRGAHT